MKPDLPAAPKEVLAYIDQAKEPHRTSVTVVWTVEDFHGNTLFVHTDRALIWRSWGIEAQTLILKALQNEFLR